VTVKTGSRVVALAVDAVLGIRDVPTGSVDALPPLFQGIHLDVISAVGTLDSELLLVLRSARLVPEEVWATIEAGGPAA
jgi:purine-binding chemotaxis protein CheW